MRNGQLVIYLLAMLSLCSVAEVATYTVWQHQPIALQLPIKQARTIRFPNAVTVGLPASLQHQLTLTNEAGVLIFTAQQAFKEARVLVKDTITNQTMTLDLNATRGSSTLPLHILYQAPTETTGWLEKPAALQGEQQYITLTRYAEQQLVCPNTITQKSV